MSLFKKKPNNEIPEIPPAPTLPPLNIIPEQKRPVVDLPIVQGDVRDSANRDVIKSAVEDSSEKISGDGVAEKSPSIKVNEYIENLQVAPTQTAPQQFQTFPIPPKPVATQLPPPPRYDRPVFSESLPIPPQTEKPIDLSFGQTKPQEKSEEVQLPSPEVKTVKKDASESIFVRIDKFHSAKHDIEEVERDLRQINNIIEKITDIKMREDEEILEINKTIEEIKEKLGKIDTEIFNRI